MTPLNIMALCSYSNDPVPEISFFVPFERRENKNKTRKHIDNPEIGSRNPRSITYIRENITKKTPSASGPNEINIKGNHTIPEPGNMYQVEQQKKRRQA